MDASFETLIASYLANNVGLSLDFLEPNLCNHLANNILSLKEVELLVSAGIGNDLKLQNNQTIRRDKIFWLDKKNNNEYENAFFEKIDAFISYLNETCYAGITGYEFHYSLYEKGAFYKRHLDQFKDNSSRQFSMISYLNPNWKKEDGGELQVFHENRQQKIEPKQGTTVFFKSSELEHEVLETNARRMSVTGWLKRG
jgi:SM-20-related protein